MVKVQESRLDMPNRPLDILAIAAHRDDVEQTCGGTLLKMAQRGHRTGILDLTQGEMGRVARPKTASGKRMQPRRSCKFPGERRSIFPTGVSRTPGKIG